MGHGMHTAVGVCAGSAYTAALQSTWVAVGHIVPSEVSFDVSRNSCREMQMKCELFASTCQHQRLKLHQRQAQSCCLQLGQSIAIRLPCTDRKLVRRRGSRMSHTGRQSSHALHAGGAQPPGSRQDGTLSGKPASATRWHGAGMRRQQAPAVYAYHRPCRSSGRTRSEQGHGPRPARQASGKAGAGRQHVAHAYAQHKCTCRAGLQHAPQ